MRKSDKKRGNGAKAKKPSLKERFLFYVEAVRRNLPYYLVILAAAALIDFMIRPMSALELSGFQIGQPSPRVISSPLEFEYVDVINTQIRQQQAESLISPIYHMRPENMDAMKNKIRRLADAARTKPFEEMHDADNWAKQVLAEAEFPLENAAIALPDSTPDDANIPKTLYESLFFYRNYESLWKSIDSHIDDAAGRGIAENVIPLNREAYLKNAAEANRLSVPVTLIAPDGARYAAPVQEIRTPLQFFDQFQQRFTSDFPDPVKDLAARKLAEEIIKTAFSGPTLIYDQEQTETLKQEARNEVAPLIVHVNKDETIIGKNALVTELDFQALSALRSTMRISPLAEMGYLILSLLFILIVQRYLNLYHPEVAVDTRKITVIFVGIVMIFALTRVAVHLSLLDLGSHKLANAPYAIPLGALGVILTLLVQSRLALFCCALTSLYMGIILNGGLNQISLPYVIVAFVTACGAIYTVSRIRQRSDLYRAGGVAIFLACALILALSLFQHKYVDQLMIRAQEVKWALIWGGVNGGLISILSMALLPIFEDFYGMVTDMKLLELSQKTDLLQRLEQEAPGSYQHSMRVATLAETAAEAIGANALLTRVGCYYHDIGKIHKPQYFVENQQTSADKAKHSKLTTNLSCLLIRSHVKDGIKLGQDYKLPEVIINFIPEHHGTTLMSYFYHQALNEAGAEGTVKEADFRYPGPKPQSRETAIAMLADALEASARTLETPNERDVRQLVRKIINARFMDEQFDECNLTLKDLHTLSLTFSDSILSMLHQRIVYPAAPAPREKKHEVASGAIEKEADSKHTESKALKADKSDEAKTDFPAPSNESKPAAGKQTALKLE
ncbi:MAG: HDIG domain-containing protein [Candidatus Omnitrophica bacterium]|nr:HDIG domain-containing protein [Candidatus Omnitrophota bacterium]